MDERAWAHDAIRRIEADFNRSADTHLMRVEFPALNGITLYLKDESTHATGSLKHRLARSLFLYGLCNGWIRQGVAIVEASSGSTAVSEAYFARLLNLPFIAVMPRGTSCEKVAQIEFYGGRCHFTDSAAAVVGESRRLAAELGGHFMDQFTYAERATDWRGNNNIAEAIFQQLAHEECPEPAWIVCGAGTGGASATIGRYLRYRRRAARLCLVDPENSVFAESWRTGDRSLTSSCSSAVEGIGRQRVEPSFLPTVIDRVITPPDAASFAAMRFLSRLIGRSVGGSTGVNLWGCVELMAEMRRDGLQGSVVTLLCDSGDRYRDTYHNDAWLAARGYDLAPHTARLEKFFATGEW